ncbi:hypothetical protein CC86DRAFT_432395 [Ophiobolus disseminans]|uniref:Uncharacterized protein n=1 Tax=Ophiobolus disseminans TaxID=1469910 RepID=A0A6A6ZE57_9PLEO|nr:hypothetical protein CC86DRAFT_432395 [Ophiobolus disseminans]
MYTAAACTAVPSSRYDTPNPYELMRSRISLVLSHGKRTMIHAPEPLVDDISRYLPPPGDYHDMSSLESSFAERDFEMDDIVKCTSCWYARHVANVKRCKERCKSRGGRPKRDMQLRPRPDELAYLIVAGVFMYKQDMHFWDPLVVFLDHPAVKKFYNNKPMPKRIGRVSHQFSVVGYGVYLIPAKPKGHVCASDSSGGARDGTTTSAQDPASLASQEQVLARTKLMVRQPPASRAVPAPVSGGYIAPSQEQLQAQTKLVARQQSALQPVQETEERLLPPLRTIMAKMPEQASQPLLQDHLPPLNPIHPHPPLQQQPISLLPRLLSALLIPLRHRPNRYPRALPHPRRRQRPRSARATRQKEAPHPRAKGRERREGAVYLRAGGVGCEAEIGGQCGRGCE